MDKKKQTPTDPLEARKEARRRRRRRQQILRASLLIGIVLLLLLVGAFVVLRIIGIQAAEDKKPSGILAVKEILVEGETRYSPEEIIKKSGLYVGQSLLAVNKVQAHDALLQSCPYLSYVEVGNATFDTLRIYVEETKVMGAVALAEGGWMILGDNNHALEQVAEEDLPAGTLRVVGATLAGETVGGTLLDERSLRICRTLVAAAKQYGLETMTTINLTKKTDIFLLLKERMKVVLGNETNLPVQIEALVDLLPTLLNNNGENAAGRLDMTSYSDSDSGNNRAVYTPEEVLREQEKKKEESTTASQPTPEGTTGTTGG